MGEQPFFSIIIPTRNRHETLIHTIKTVLNQDFEDFELIISDNNSTEETFLAVNEFEDLRLKYFNTKSSLSMIDSWEFALDKSSGKYVIFFGDDDGLVDGALIFLFKLLINGKQQVINWARVSYYWPDMTPAELSDHLSIPLFSENHGSYLDSQKIFDEIMHGRYYTILPMLYNSVVSKEVINKIKEDTDGVLFASKSPDVYSGFAIAHTVKQYLSLTIPLSINGASKYSNGIASMFRANNNSINKEFNQLNEKIQGNRNRFTIPPVRSIYYAVIDSYLQYIDRFNDTVSLVDEKKIITLILSSLKVFNIEERQVMYEQITDYANKSIELSTWFKAQYKLENIPISSIIPNISHNHIFSNNTLEIEPQSFGIKNVFDASLFAGKILKLATLDVNLLSFDSKVQPERKVTTKILPRIKSIIVKQKKRVKNIILKSIQPNRSFQYNRSQLIAIAENYPSIVNNGYRHIEKTVDLVHFFKLDPSYSIIDVGGADGAIAKQFSGNFPNATVYTFEPIANTFKELQDNIEGYSKIKAINKGLGAQVGKHPIFKLSRVTSSSLFPAQEKIRNEFFAENLQHVEEELITISTLDDEIPAQEDINILKIDVQGYEVEVLKGATATLKNTRIIVVEMQNHELYEGAPKYFELDAYIRSFGFCLYDIVPSIREDKQLYEWDGIYVNNSLL